MTLTRDTFAPKRYKMATNNNFIIQLMFDYGIPIFLADFTIADPIISASLLV